MSRSPGWYPDPTNPPRLRYWDGSAWTDRTADPVEVDVDPAASSPRRRRLVVAAVVVGLVAVGAWKLIPWPNVARERAINAVAIGVSSGGAPIAREQAECVADAANRLGVPYGPMERTDELTDEERRHLLDATLECHLEQVQLNARP